MISFKVVTKKGTRILVVVMASEELDGLRGDPPRVAMVSDIGVCDEVAIMAGTTEQRAREKLLGMGMRIEDERRSADLVKGFN